MDKYEVSDLISAALEGKPSDFKDAFDKMVGQRAVEKIQSLSANYGAPPEEEEVDGTEPEVDDDQDGNEQEETD